MKRMMISVVVCWVSAVAVFGQQADIRIVKQGGLRKGISVDGLAASGGMAAVFRKTLEGDLGRSGYFEVVPSGRGMISVEGGCQDAGGTLALGCKVRGLADNRVYLEKNTRQQSDTARYQAHILADEIIKAVLGKTGLSGTRIVFIGNVGGRKNLYVCDADGQGVQQITRDGVPCLSPTWGRDATTVFYTSFVSGYPDVYRINLGNYSRTRLISFPGVNVGADISPDGGRLALTLSKDGNPDIYVVDAASRQATRVTRTQTCAEASPSWSPNGQQLVYVSNKARLPHLYIISAAGGAERRLTFKGSENVEPDWGTDGRIVYSSKRGGRYQLCLATAGGEGEQLTSDGYDHEDPSWAPDNRHVVYTKTGGYQSSLYVFDTEEKTEVKLTGLGGNCYSASWSPR